MIKSFLSENKTLFDSSTFKRSSFLLIKKNSYYWFLSMRGVRSLHNPKVFHMDMDKLLSEIRTKLPIQNPLHSFVHNNVLQMFEGKDFHDGVAEAGKLYRARPYWPEHLYHEKFKQGKITDEDILRAIDHYLGQYQPEIDLGKLGLSPKEFFYRLMFSDLKFNDDEVQPNISDDHLWGVCREKTEGLSLVLKRSPVKWRAKEYWERYHNESFSLSIHPYIIRLISSYLDQGQSFWANPFSQKGFWSFFTYDVAFLKGFAVDWQKNLAKKIEKYQGQTPSQIIEAELREMEIPEHFWKDYLLEILFDLKGWSGMVNKLEMEPWQAPVKSPDIKLMDYLAALVLLESSIDSFHAEEHSIDLSLLRGRVEKIELHSYQLALSLYQITKSFKLESRWMQRLLKKEITEFIDQIDSAEAIHKIRLWHEAYEHHFHREAIQSLGSHHYTNQGVGHDADVFFCIDDREESIRRHVEEVDPKVRTYGVVGFFGIDMKFSSLRNQRLIAQCPPVVNPSRIVREAPCDTHMVPSFQKWNMKKGGGDLALYYNSRTLFRGYLSTMILGVASIIPMFMQVFFPKQSKILKKKILKLFGPEPKTEMMIEAGEEGHGYSKSEMASIVANILSQCGINTVESSLVFVMAHGSSSTNNPFKQAYGCGACGGNAGIPNSKAFAKMANDPFVREELLKKNIMVPKETFFVAGFHDTCTDEMHFFNEESVPTVFKETYSRVKNNLIEAGKLNAFERCQRFSSSEARSTPEEALKHVKERALDLAQPRPEYGHSSNALAIVGRREMTKGLFLNRRAFLHTYDWRLDPDGSVLANVVLGGVPVAVNINLDYYFSRVDNDNFGCGSKLPLNMTSLLGVMTGSLSDLRIGLARQMVEIHEPIRNLTIIEAPLERVKKLFLSHPRLKNILYHHWMRLAVYDPETKVWSLFGHDSFAPVEFDPHPMKHFKTSLELIHTTHTEEDFAEIGNA